MSLRWAAMTGARASPLGVRVRVHVRSERIAVGNASETKKVVSTKAPSAAGEEDWAVDWVLCTCYGWRSG